MTDVAGLLPVFAYLATVLVSVPLALVAFAVARRVHPFSRALRAVTVGVAGLLGVACLALAVLVGPGAALALATTAVGAGAVLAATPLVVARAVLVREGVPPETALRYATAGWPLAMLGSVVVFLAPGGPARYNISFLTGTAAVVAWTAFALVVLLGPTVAALALARWRGPKTGA